ncbi:alpha-ketoacid dehydrogenase subunit beta [Bacillus sp. V5-8f]|uniref:alpha-ketoacid dehydrogenase subunit beta n=1 Tax=Bacillus sp. V5-8f TaxID=2053044 RepID=UPI000C78D9F7|nr:alpha-ketoacid dehydrogenase subunit beta [Bacillus sp. V5-8f]PLT35438.1 alpha-ketoacid dehydrogenase subunit beta [Bacillus sp. V5-8f]
MAMKSMVQAINEAISQAMEADTSILALGQDIGANGGVFRVTDNLQKRFGESRVIDTPLAESGIVGASIGLAANGFKPIVEIQFMGFMYSTMDQVCSQLSRSRMRTGASFSTPIVIRGPFGGGVRALELHSDSMEAFFTHTPGLKVVIPSNPYDAKGLLLSAIDDPDPVIFFEPMRLYRSFQVEVPNEPYRIPLGDANIIREGEDITLISWGAPVGTARKTAEYCAEKMDVSIEVVDLRSLVPFDYETVMNSVRKTGRVIITHEAVRTNGFGAEVATRIMEEAFLYLQCPIKRVTGYDTPYPFTQVEEEWLPNKDRLIRAVQEVMDY